MRQDEVTIESAVGWPGFGLNELYAYRDMLIFMSWRGIRARYAQSVAGLGWAVIQPLMSTVVFTIVFGKMVRIPSLGIPYPVFALAGLMPWTYFSNAVTLCADSLITGSSMLGKVYFPRLIFPLSAIASKLVDLLVVLVAFAVVMVIYGIRPTTQLAALPVLVLLLVFAAAGVGIWLSALALQYRDVKYATPFVLQAMLFMVPVVYPVGMVPKHLRAAYALDPMVGIVEGFKAALTGAISIPWNMLLQGSVVSSILLLSGVVYFRYREPLFADVA